MHVVKNLVLFSISVRVQKARVEAEDVNENVFCPRKQNGHAGISSLQNRKVLFIQRSHMLKCNQSARKCCICHLQRPTRDEMMNRYEDT